MTIDVEPFRPPHDPCFNKLLESALSGNVPVYGAVLEAAKVHVRRFDDRFRPENSLEGQKVLASLMQGWNSGSPINHGCMSKRAFMCVPTTTSLWRCWNVDTRQPSRRRY